MVRRTDDAASGAPRAQHVGPTDVLAFLCELALVVLLVVAGWRLGTSTGLAAPLPVLLGVLLALALPAAAIAVWGRWLAPRAARRLSQPWRLDAQIAVFVASGLVVAAAGLVWWGVGLALVGTTAFALTRDH
ncbi:YrdB family protein [Cellulosimicrobium sp. PMB13]|uniref:YrdB family protein n=1 Tax=Cellulosimicrobium sp. PMB13 TaxID=3120158 RepID=UPI003F4C766F